MAELTDVTITPMIAVGMGATMFAVLRYTDWSWPVVYGLGLTVGPIVGFGAGVVLFAFVSGVIHGLLKIGVAKTQSSFAARRRGYYAVRVKKMSRVWKEQYHLETARKLGIHELEGCRIVGWDESGWKLDLESQSPSQQSPSQLSPQWIYYVEVCGFTFAFYSVAMMEAYLAYYSQKVLASRIRNTPHCNNDLRQDVFTRLPLYLREEPKRLKVMKALQKAIDTFGNSDKQ